MRDQKEAQIEAELASAMVESSADLSCRSDNSSEINEDFPKPGIEEMVQVKKRKVISFASPELIEEWPSEVEPLPKTVTFAATPSELKTISFATTPSESKVMSIDFDVKKRKVISFASPELIEDWPSAVEPLPKTVTFAATPSEPKTDSFITQPEPKTVTFAATPSDLKTISFAATPSEPKTDSFITQPEPKTVTFAATQLEPKTVSFVTQLEPKTISFVTQPEPKTVSFVTQPEPKTVTFAVTQPEPKVMSMDFDDIPTSEKDVSQDQLLSEKIECNTSHDRFDSLSNLAYSPVLSEAGSPPAPVMSSPVVLDVGNHSLDMVDHSLDLGDPAMETGDPSSHGVVMTDIENVATDQINEESKKTRSKR